MPDPRTRADFATDPTSDTKEWTIDDHWNPRDGWVKDLNGNGMDEIVLATETDNQILLITDEENQKFLKV